LSINLFTKLLSRCVKSDKVESFRANKTTRKYSVARFDSREVGVCRHGVNSQYICQSNYSPC